MHLTIYLIASKGCYVSLLYIEKIKLRHTFFGTGILLPEAKCSLSMTMAQLSQPTLWIERALLGTT